MADFIAALVTQLGNTSLAEGCAVILALAYVVLAARQSRWCWLCAFLSTAIYTWLFWQVTLPFQAALNLYYMVMAGYGYYQWNRQSDTESRVISWPLLYHALLIPGLLTIAWGLSQWAEGQFNSEHLLLDASIQVVSVVTTVMVAHKVLQNWLYWFVINALSSYLYFQSGLALSACLFFAYVGFSVYGYVEWQKQWRGQRANAQVTS